MANLTTNFSSCEYFNVTQTFSNESGSYANTSVICLKHAPILTQQKIIRVSILTCMAIISLLGNLATVWNIRLRQLTRRTSRQNGSTFYRLIMHLAISDIFVTVFCIVGDAVWTYTVKWIFGDLGCRIFKVMQMFSLYLSTFILVLIGIDRCVAVKYPMKSLNSSNRYNRLLFLSYISAFIFSSPQVINIFNLS